MVVMWVLVGAALAGDVQVQTPVGVIETNESDLEAVASTYDAASAMHGGMLATTIGSGGFWQGAGKSIIDWAVGLLPEGPWEPPQLEPTCEDLHLSQRQLQAAYEIAMDDVDEVCADYRVDPDMVVTGPDQERYKDPSGECLRALTRAWAAADALRKLELAMLDKGC